MGDQENDLSNLSEEDILEYTRAQGRKLGFYISNSTLDEEIKMELFALIKKLNIGQIEQLLNVFETKYLDEKTLEIDEKYQDEIKDILEDAKKQEEELKSSASKRLEEFSKKLNVDSK